MSTALHYQPAATCTSHHMCHAGCSASCKNQDKNMPQCDITIVHTALRSQLNLKPVQCAGSVLRTVRLYVRCNTDNGARPHNQLTTNMQRASPFLYRNKPAAAQLDNHCPSLHFPVHQSGAVTLVLIRHNPQAGRAAHPLHPSEHPTLPRSHASCPRLSPRTQPKLTAARQLCCRQRGRRRTARWGRRDARLTVVHQAYAARLISCTHVLREVVGVAMRLADAAPEPPL
mmetsp:Transcript_48275/g.108741  ORF Transcript_48275/g.108741 Transcript_48275/m.108741 type:complete len:229 (+) Transcript_48275:77-763(+)